jgi:hypothetical protein
MTAPRADATWPGRANKVDIVVEIAHRIHVDPPRMSTGSTEPRAIFDLVNEQLGLGANVRLGKPELARAIVESSGAAWHPDFESRGATVTKRGLLAVLTAVEFFLE